MDCSFSGTSLKREHVSVFHPFRSWISKMESSNWWIDLIQKLAHFTLSSIDNLCKKFGSRSVPTKCQSWSGSKLTKCRTWSGSKPFDTLLVFLNELFREKWNKSADNNKRINKYKALKYSNYNLRPLQIQNGQIHVYCINMYEKIYQNEKGYYYKRNLKKPSLLVFFFFFFK